MTRAKIMRWIATVLSRDTYVNVMDQHYPAHKAETESRFAHINRRLDDSELNKPSNTRGRWDYGGSIDAGGTWCRMADRFWLPWMRGRKPEEAFVQRELISKGRGPVNLQRFHSLLGPLLEKFLLERSHVGRHKVLARQYKPPAPVPLRGRCLGRCFTRMVAKVHG